MGLRRETAMVFLVLTVQASTVFAENWVEFHQEQWGSKSGKLKKVLNYRNRFYYDAGNLVRTSAGDVTLWVKEVSDNDQYYVKKGNPQSETFFRQIQLWCAAKKYEILQVDGGDTGMNQSTGSDIPPGTYYQKLHDTLCSKQAGH